MTGQPNPDHVTAPYEEPKRHVTHREWAAEARHTELLGRRISEIRKAEKLRG